MATRAELERQLKELTATVSGLQDQIKEQRRIADATVRRFFAIPQRVSQILRASGVGDAKLTSDGRGLSYEIGETIVLTITNDDTFQLHDVAGNMIPRDFRFGHNADFSVDSVSAIIAYYHVARDFDSMGDLGNIVEQLNTALTPA